MRDLTDLLNRPGWQAQANCRGLNPNLFFTTPGESVAPAKAVCAGCPVTEQCLQAGFGEDFGIWGGEAIRARQQIRAERRRAEATRVEREARAS